MTGGPSTLKALGEASAERAAGPPAHAGRAGQCVSAELAAAIARQKQRLSSGSGGGHLAGVIEEDEDEEDEDDEDQVAADADDGGSEDFADGSRGSTAALRRWGKGTASADAEGEDAPEDRAGSGQGLAGDAVPTSTSTRSAGQLEAVLPLVLEWVAAAELMGPLPLVSRAWSRAAAAAFNWRSAEVSEEVVDEEDVDDIPNEGEAASEEEAVRRVLQARAAEARAADGTVTLSGIKLAVPLIGRHAAFHQAHPWGAFLSEGAYKKVYAVWSKALGRREAVSVMDVEAIADAGACDVVRAEVRCACLVSELVRTGVCPNFVQTFQVLATSFEPSEALWGTEHCRLPRGPLSNSALRWASEHPGPTEFRLPVPAGPDGEVFSDPNAVDLGVFQLARMELCSGGDVEEHLRSIEPLVAAVEMAEMAAVAHALAAQPGFVLKLADFGTADTREESLGNPVRARHVTTLENTALDLLVMGDSTKQDFHADSWATGLCVLHLLTGAAPYEEVLEEVLCPAPLRKALYNAWTGRTWGRRKRPASEPGFAALEPVLREDEEDGTLADTVARIVVLFGLPRADDGPAASCSVPEHLWTEADAAAWDAPSPPSLEAPEVFGKSVVWRTLQQWLGSTDTASSAGTAKRASARTRRPTARSGRQAKSADKDVEEVRAWFKTAQERFNVWTGSHELMQRARRRMAAAPGTAALLWALCQFDAEKRPRASDLLASSAALEPLRQAGVAGGAAAASLESYGEVWLPALACPSRDDV